MFLRRKVEMPVAGQAPSGRTQPILAKDAEHFVFSRPLYPPYPAEIQTIDLGLGCFWGAERLFWQLGRGVWVTAVGYAGGFTPNPTYEEVCTGRTGHTEIVRVAFDAGVLPIETLLKTFWEAHDPTQGFRQGNDVGTQYRSAIFTHESSHLAAAEAARARYQTLLTERGFGPITTEIRPAPPFYLAEDYHQQYLAKVPHGYCGLSGTGVACPIAGSGPAAAT
ncbi:MAG: peptide-methionine (S)-S-oxide reductase MsrA [Hyphomicrobium sp.]